MVPQWPFYRINPRRISKAHDNTFFLVEGNKILHKWCLLYESSSGFYGHTRAYEHRLYNRLASQLYMSLLPIYFCLTFSRTFQIVQHRNKCRLNIISQKLSFCFYLTYRLFIGIPCDSCYSRNYLFRRIPEKIKWRKADTK